MKINPGGYSSAQFDNARLRKLARDCAAAIPHFMKQLDATAIVVQGKSGMSAAFATQMLIDFPLVVVRKKGEDSHGSKIEGTDELDLGNYIILDDFIDSGTTVERVQSEISISYESWPRGLKPRLVGVLEWMRITSYPKYELDDGRWILRAGIDGWSEK